MNIPIFYSFTIIPNIGDFYAKMAQFSIALRIFLIKKFSISDLTKPEFPISLSS
jgi:hypothetical protein